MGRLKDLIIEINEYFSSRPEEYARLCELRATVSDEEFVVDAGLIEASRVLGISADFLMTSFEVDEGE
jgi:hypothetical protein